MPYASEKDSDRTYKIAVIPGDGIGREVVPEGVRVLEAAAKQFGFELQLDEFDFASCDYYLKHNKMVPDDWKEQIGRHDAIFFGAVGWPEKVPDHISLWGSLILFRRLATSTSSWFVRILKASTPRLAGKSFLEPIGKLSCKRP
jgi:tartrate dehydrogenase/decarboxylase/D-malate dehydrogenase